LHAHALGCPSNGRLWPLDCSWTAPAHQPAAACGAAKAPITHLPTSRATSLTPTIPRWPHPSPPHAGCTTMCAPSGPSYAAAPQSWGTSSQGTRPHRPLCRRWGAGRCCASWAAVSEELHAPLAAPHPTDAAPPCTLPISRALCPIEVHKQLSFPVNLPPYTVRSRSNRLIIKYIDPRSEK